jgi:hypothetical protein
LFSRNSLLKSTCPYNSTDTGFSNARTVCEQRVCGKADASNAIVKPRKSWLLATSALASSSLGVAEPALAVNECGLLVGGSITCPAANYPTLGISDERSRPT